MQATKIEITVATEIAQVVAVETAVESTSTVRFTDLQVIGGGMTCQW
jgi:hypothetical protein